MKMGFRNRIVFLFSPYEGTFEAVSLRPDLDRKQPLNFGRIWIETSRGLEIAASTALIHRDLATVQKVQEEWVAMMNDSKFYA